MNRIAARVSRLEDYRGAEQARKPGQPWWWELPEDQWHVGAVGLSHEDALAELDAAPDAADEGGAP